MKKILSFVFAVLLLLISSSGVYAEENNSELFEQLLEERANDTMFIKEMRESPETAYEMINQILEERTSISIKSGSYSEASCYVPAIMQSETWYCGYATTLQTIYGLGLETTVSGSNNDEKQDTIANAMGSPSSSAVVYKIKNYLNEKITSSKYIYTEVEDANWSQLSFSNEVAGSLMLNRPVILHAKTGTLSYYNGKNINHYLSVDYINNYKNTVRIKDCHYNTKYFGSHTVPTSEAFGTVNLPGRYIIYN